MSAHEEKMQKHFNDDLVAKREVVRQQRAELKQREADYARQGDKITKPQEKLRIDELRHKVAKSEQEAAVAAERARKYDEQH